MLKNVRPSTRAPRNGAIIYCPACNTQYRASHFNWHEFTCLVCKNKFLKTQFLFDNKVSYSAYLILNRLLFRSTPLRLEAILKRKPKNALIDQLVKRLLSFTYSELQEQFDTVHCILKKHKINEREMRSRIYNIIIETIYETLESKDINELRKLKLMKISMNSGLA